MSRRAPGPIRVGFPVASLNRGGAELQALALAERLPPDRFEVSFLCRWSTGIHTDRARAAGIRVIPVGTPGSGGPISRAGAGLGRITGYLRAVRELDLDIVDAWLYPADAMAAALKDLTGRPVVLSGRRNMTPHPGNPVVVRVAEALLNRRVAAIVANSSAAAAFAIDVQHATPGKVRVIRNGVEIPAVPPADAIAHQRAELGAGPDDRVIGCIGNLRAVKRQLLLVDAFRRIHDTRPETRLVLVGDGPLRAEIEGRVAALGLTDAVRLIGSVPDVNLLCHAFDLVVQASESEGMPNVILEAAAAGRPIVATDAGGTREIVLDGLTGVLVPTQGDAALVDGVLSLLGDPDRAASLGAAARAHVEATFGMERFVAERAALYESVLAGRP